MAMGQNTYGQLGDGSTTDRSSSPVQVVDSLGNPLSGVVGSSTGPNYTVYLKSDGTVWAVGMNSYGQLGDGTQTPRSNPEPVLDSSGNALSGVVGVSAGGEHTVFLKADGTVWATGYNAFGQLGDGTTTDRLYPVQGDLCGRVSAHGDRGGFGVWEPHRVFEKRRDGLDGGKKLLWATGGRNDHGSE